MRLPRVRYVNVLGASIPSTVVALVALTAGATILDVLTGRWLAFGAGLVPEYVLRGELWRLVTWTWIESSPLGLIFSCLLLAMLGRDLSPAWGHWRFASVYLGFTAAVGAATCGLALLLPALRAIPYLTAWAMVDAMLIAWAIQFPHRQILVYMVIPVAGRNLVYLTVAGTALFAVFSSPLLFVPHFIAIGFMLVFARYPALDLIWLRLRILLLRRPPARRNSGLHVVRSEEQKSRWLH